jgi:peptidoglycan/xylan/chitin deacetylase (PgdA/CDA1 family)
MSRLLRTKRFIVREVARTSRAVTTSRSGRVVTLCYHSVHPTRPGATPPSLLAAHLSWLVSNCDVIGYPSVLEAARESRDKPAVAITFDDAYADNHEYALPLLVEHGIPATFFLLAGALEHDAGVLAGFRRLTRDQEFEPLTWSQIEEMRAEGMGVGSHSWSHPNFARIDESSAREELVRSKGTIEDRTNSSVTHFAYPFGKPKRHFTAATAALVRAAGYESAAAIVARGVQTSDSPFSIPRMFSTVDSVSQLDEKVVGYRDLHGWWQEHAPLWLARRLAPEDFAV